MKRAFLAALVLSACGGGTEFLADEWRMEIGTADAFGATGTAESPKAGERPLQCFWSRRDPIVDYMPRKGWIENGGQR